MKMTIIKEDFVEGQFDDVEGIGYILISDWMIGQPIRTSHYKLVDLDIRGNISVFEYMRPFCFDELPFLRPFIFNLFQVA